VSRTVPTQIQALVDERLEARRERDWPRADALRAEIEADGWKVIDFADGTRLETAHPPDVVEEGRTRYGSSASVPSRLDEAPVGLATVVMQATDWPDDLARALGGIQADAPAATSVVVVADDPSIDQVAELDGSGAGGAEIVWTSARLGHASSLNAGIRRAPGPVVVVMDTSVEPTGDVVSPLVAALADPSVAVAGSHGVVTADLRRFEAAPAGDVDAVLGYVMAFRRSDFADRGPLDERFRFYRNLDLWWSLVLRDEGEGRVPRRAVALDLPVTLHEHRDWVGLAEAERARLSKRNFYRIIDRFGHRRDLASGA
jgi:hypothetical protein